MSRFRLAPSGYILRAAKPFDVIVGRVYGQDKPNSATYQLAGRPFDEVPVHGHDRKQLAFEAAVKELEMRDGIDEAIK
ncbi:hypothetical protein UFOVP1077_36 [uncultured Caudovirales phage]|uniref:Uncharacterized protein n=1 Tax=uncultured Caudovirales phage TaxID=2100421 RepID=A0A6J7XGY3_9CAUD|nr:hypothetical protein UFOVP1077_36 [uncultured Caudovirales phage]CAB4197647.1 hypothetical protein UFOVP1316_24 [uncultured Caudovirales phage]CAB4211412.1 hypothetical protein UFOVP1428_33 [uncultured Caudovirales phage]CAB5227146.1 hypothetical protein UFOVP1526_11 [uncultured Caudovirales phage]